MWSEPAPRWELFEGRTREPEPGSRADAVIALTFLLILVAVAVYLRVTRGADDQARA